MRVKYATKMRIKWAKSGDPGQNLGYDSYDSCFFLKESYDCFYDY